MTKLLSQYKINQEKFAFQQKPTFEIINTRAKLLETYSEVRPQIICNISNATISITDLTPSKENEISTSLHNHILQFAENQQSDQQSLSQLHYIEHRKLTV
jgi:hypothetical protein